MTTLAEQAPAPMTLPSRWRVVHRTAGGRFLPVGDYANHEQAEAMRAILAKELPGTVGVIEVVDVLALAGWTVTPNLADAKPAAPAPVQPAPAEGLSDADIYWAIAGIIFAAVGIIAAVVG